MKSRFTILVLLNLLLLLIFFNLDVLHKEDTLKDGQLVLLKLAPVDPRSLMQGDYMTLRFDVMRNTRSKDIPNRGFLILTLNEENVGEKVRFQHDFLPKSSKEMAIRYFFGSRDPVIGAESFFFQEGEGEKYESAKYGGLKVDNDGKGILTGLYDKELRLID